MRRLATLTCLIGLAAIGTARAQTAPAFAPCAGCHSLAPGQNGVGPTLYGVYGRKVASVKDYAYSPALKAKGGTWTAAALDAYLTDPAKVAPGTKMAFAGYPDAADRKAVIAVLKAAH